MFQGWEAFYTLIGTCSGALISLLFVVVTLTSGRERPDNNRGTNVYMTPTVFHFGVVIVVSATALAPRLSSGLVELGIGASALVGLTHMGIIGLQFSRRDFPSAPHWSDFWCYVAAPTLIYLALGGAAIGLRMAPTASADALGLFLLTLMLVAIRNAWDLVTWLAPRRDEAAGDPPASPSA